MAPGRMKRRAFLSLLAGATVPPLLWPRVARAQQETRTPRIGVLWPNPPATFEALRHGLRELGYVEGQNVAFEFRWAESKLDQLAELAAELVRLKVDVIVTLAPQATLAAKQATRTIPIVFVAMGDPIASGVVDSLARPGANLTGTTRMIAEMSAKHVELLKEAVPSLARLAVLWNPTNSSHRPALQSVAAAARSLSLDISGFVQPALEGNKMLCRLSWRAGTEKADHRDCALLRGRRARPKKRRCGGRSAAESNEFAPLHSITSSARASNIAGTSRPSAFAALRLMTS